MLMYKDMCLFHLPPKNLIVPDSGVFWAIIFFSKKEKSGGDRFAQMWRAW